MSHHCSGFFQKFRGMNHEWDSFFTSLFPILCEFVFNPVDRSGFYIAILYVGCMMGCVSLSENVVPRKQIQKIHLDTIILPNQININRRNTPFQYFQTQPNITYSPVVRRGNGKSPLNLHVYSWENHRTKRGSFK